MWLLCLAGFALWTPSVFPALLGSYLRVFSMLAAGSTSVLFASLMFLHGHIFSPWWCLPRYHDCMHVHMLMIFVGVLIPDFPLSLVCYSKSLPASSLSLSWNIHLYCPVESPNCLPHPANDPGSCVSCFCLILILLAPPPTTSLTWPLLPGHWPALPLTTISSVQGLLPNGSPSLCPFSMQELQLSFKNANCFPSVPS